MKHNDKISYSEVLEMLKGSNHKAPDLWGSIEEELVMQDHITDLPSYAAPDNLWEGIEEQLPTTKSVGTPKSKSNAWMVLIGVVLGVLILAGIQFLMQTDEGLDFKYKSEVEFAELNNNRVELSDDLDDALLYIENNSFLFTEQEMTEFNEQLKAINEALEDLMKLQEKYGLDDSANKLFAKMERDKAKLLKTMISNT